MTKLKVFYNEKQSTEAETDFSPSAKKPAALVQHWLDTDQPIEVVSDFFPASKEQFYRAHEQEHLDQILACQKNNGFLNQSPKIAATLPWTSGSLLAAALHAWHAKSIAMSPTSGFHHATHCESMGFCTLNGLMVTVLDLLHPNCGRDLSTRWIHGIKKVGILDLDHHYGNGTDAIIKWASVPKERIHHYTVGGDMRFNETFGSYGGREYYRWQGGDASERWLKALPEILEKFRGCDIVLFQAGADPHIDDPCHAMIGGVGALTNEQFVERDRMVFETLWSEMKIPIAWNLAGGYQTPLQKVLDIHTGTLTECLKVL